MGNFCVDCNKKLSKPGYKRCKSCSQKGNLNHQYKNGKVLDVGGYVLVLAPNHPFANNKGRVREHRLIMEAHLGRYLRVDEHIDHINGIRVDNRIENLRLATRSQNAANQKLSSQNTSGYKGVTKSKQDRRWRAQIKINQKLIVVGWFETKEEAARAYDKKALKLFGDFAYLNFPSK